MTTAWTIEEYEPVRTAGSDPREREYHVAVGGWVFDQALADRGVQCPWHLRMRSTLAEPGEEPGFAFCVGGLEHEGPHRHCMEGPPPHGVGRSVWVWVTARCT